MRNADVRPIRPRTLFRFAFDLCETISCLSEIQDLRCAPTTIHFLFSQRDSFPSVAQRHLHANCSVSCMESAFTGPTEALRPTHGLYSSRDSAQTGFRHLSTRMPSADHADNDCHRAKEVVSDQEVGDVVTPDHGSTAPTSGAFADAWTHDWDRCGRSRSSSPNSTGVTPRQREPSTLELIMARQTGISTKCRSRWLRSPATTETDVPSLLSQENQINIP